MGTDQPNADAEARLVLERRAAFDAAGSERSRKGTKWRRWRHRHHPAVLQDLLEGGLQHQIWIVAAQRSGAEGVHLAIELLADPAHLVFADAIQAERLSERVDVAGADAVDA